MLLGELLHPSIPLFLYFIEGLVDLSFDLPLFAGIIILFLSFSFVLGDFSAGGGRCGGGRERGSGFLGFESSLVWDWNVEWWWGWRFLFDGGFGSAVRSE